MMGERSALKLMPRARTRFLVVARLIWVRARDMSVKMRFTSWFSWSADVMHARTWVGLKNLIIVSTIFVVECSITRPRITFSDYFLFSFLHFIE